MDLGRVTRSKASGGGDIDEIEELDTTTTQDQDEINTSTSFLDESTASVNVVDRSSLDDRGDQYGAKQPEHFSRDSLKELVDKDVITMSVMVSTKNNNSPLPAMVRFRGDPEEKIDRPLWYIIQPPDSDINRSVIKFFHYDHHPNGKRLRNLICDLMIFMYGLIIEKEITHEDGSTTQKHFFHLSPQARAEIVSGLRKYINDLPAIDLLRDFLQSISAERLIQLVEETTHVILAGNTSDLPAAEMIAALANLAIFVSAADSPAACTEYKKHLPEAKHLTGGGSGGSVPENVYFQWMMRELVSQTSFSVPMSVSPDDIQHRLGEQTIWGTRNMLRGPMPSRSSRADGVVMYNDAPLMYMECKSTKIDQAEFGLLTSLNSLNWSDVALYTYVSPSEIQLYRLEKSKGGNAATGIIQIHKAIIGMHTMTTLTDTTPQNAYSFPVAPMKNKQADDMVLQYVARKKEGTRYEMANNVTYTITTKPVEGNTKQIKYEGSIEQYLKSKNGPEAICDTLHSAIRKNVFGWMGTIDSLAGMFRSLDHRQAAVKFNAAINEGKLIVKTPRMNESRVQPVFRNIYPYGMLYVLTNSTVEYWQTTAGCATTETVLQEILPEVKKQIPKSRFQKIMKDTGLPVNQQLLKDLVKRLNLCVREYTENNMTEFERKSLDAAKEDFMKTYEQDVISRKVGKQRNPSEADTVQKDVFRERKEQGIMTRARARTGDAKEPTEMEVIEGAVGGIDLESDEG